MDHKARLQSHQKWIQEELERSIRFWMKNGMDPVQDRKSTRLNSSHGDESRMPSSA